jgi:Kelch motif
MSRLIITEFSPTGTVFHPRRGHTGTLLSDGRVLIVLIVGTAAHTTLNSAELYDPNTGKFAETGSMATSRWGGQTSTLLADGRVLVLGGNTSSVQEQPTASAEIYDPSTGKFKSTGSMTEPRDGQTATRLLDGRVLVVGSHGNTAELYDPGVGSFAPTGKSLTALRGQSATLLADGRVFITGGMTDEGTGISSAEIYVP